jgi:hypothetical protein
MLYGDAKEQSIKKVVHKRSIHKEVKEKTGRPQAIADISKLKSRNKQQ